MKKQTLLWLVGLAVISTFSCQPKTQTEVQENQVEETQSPGESQRSSPVEVKQGQISGKPFSIHYGSPAVKERTIWGDLVPYNVVWRTGANEATYVELSQDMTVEGKSLKAGKYSLFTIPKENSAWTVIFNSDWELEHGHFQYDEKKDVLRVEVSPVWEEQSSERLTFEIESPGIVLRWEKLKLPISIQ
jgi:hypothetical protein